MILEADETNATIAEYTLANGQLVSQNRSGTPSYYLYDAQGSVRSLTSSSGSVTDQYDYTAFGELKNYTGSSTPNNYQYTGQQYDSLTGLYSLRARYYDPANGRFLSKDTWPLDTFNPVELNRYQYAGSNPITFSDPSGYQAAEGYAGGLTIATAIGQVTLAPPTFGFGEIAILTFVNVVLALNGGEVLDLPRTETDAKPWENTGNETYKPEKNPCKGPSCKNTEKPEPNKVPEPEPYRPPVPGRGPLPLGPDIPDRDCDPAVEDCEEDDCEQNPTAEECDNEERKHITLGLSEFEYIDIRGLSEVRFLSQFTEDINTYILAGQIARAYYYTNWDLMYPSISLPSEFQARISYVFELVRTGAVEHIHFNLTSTVPNHHRSYAEFAADWENYVTSWELNTIMNDPTLCSKTTFYNGYDGPRPHPAGSNICFD